MNRCIWNEAYTIRDRLKIQKIKDENYYNWCREYNRFIRDSGLNKRLKHQPNKIIYKVNHE